MRNKILSLTKNFQFIIRLTFQVDKKLFILNSLFYLLMAILPLASLWVLKMLIDSVIDTHKIFHLTGIIYIFLFVAFQLLFSFIQQLSAYYMQKQQYLISEFITLKVLSKAVEIDYQYYEDPVFYDSLHLTQNQSSYLPSHIINTFQILIQQVITIIALAIFLISVHWSIPIFLILASFPFVFSRLIYGRRQFLLEKSIIPDQRKAADLFNYVTTNHYAKELRVFDFGLFFTKLYHQFQQSIFEKRNHLHYIFLKKGMFVAFFEVLFITLFYLVLIARSIAGTLSIGALIIYFQAFQRMQIAVQSFFKSAVIVFQHQLYLQEIMKYLDLPVLRTKSQSLDFPVDFSFEQIDLHNVNFRYPNTDRYVLQSINMHFSAGKLIAIVGENGSGKSTLLKLLCGLYKTKEGILSFSGHDANQLPSTFFSQNISVVFQDFGKYYMTIEDNIALGISNPDSDKIKSVINKATGSNILENLHLGIQTHLGRNYALGEELSGGQWQKIAIARALYKDCKVLILDEPTSALDPLAEIDFFKNIKKEVNNKIIILITHRLYNLKLADYIYVMDDSFIKESGTYNELMQNQGFFYKYFNAQKL